MYNVATSSGMVITSFIRRTDQIAQLFNGILYMIDNQIGVNISVNKTVFVKTQAIQRFNVTSLL